jgi:uracil-DNA glycosylase
MKGVSVINSLPSEWQSHLDKTINDQKFSNLSNWLNKTMESASVYPPINDIFKAYKTTNLSDIKVVILGQDPYHGESQAHGLSFSVKKGVRQPPSLKNIFKELASDLSLPIPDKFMGELTHWSEQGVFLLNSVLTVTKGNPNSHKKKGWEEFTDATIKAISNHQKNVVFVLWGNYAKNKSSLIDASKHLIISSVHPSPFSARNGFFGSKPFSKINTYLIQTNQKPINWEIK